MHKIVLFGKGGIGKSTIASSLAVVYAQQGLRVLLVGCDPKHDTTVLLTGGVPVRTAVDLPGFADLKVKEAQFVFRGKFGIDCVESGGPEPGVGCAGRGISRTIEMLDNCGLMREERYDVVLFDVLGDVVCGGFAAPLRLGFADKVCIVVSEEIMALYAANNIAKAIRNYSSNGVSLCGLVANLKDGGHGKTVVERFAQRIGTQVLEFLPRDTAVRRAEYSGVPVIERFPRSKFSRTMRQFGDVLLALHHKKLHVPTPLSDDHFYLLSRGGFQGQIDAGVSAVVRGGDAQRGGVPPRQAEPKTENVQSSVEGSSDGYLERALALWAKAEEGGGQWTEGPHGRQWGDPTQWRNFFCDLEMWRNEEKRFYLDVPLIVVSHEDMECRYATPSFDGGGHMSYFNFPWLQRLDPGWSGAKTELTTDLREIDVVGGGSQKLAEALDAAVARSDGMSAILVHSTCVPTVIGDDAAGVIEQCRRRSDAPILYTNHASGQQLDLVEYFFARVKATEAFRRAKQQPGLVNLIGFPIGRGRDELAAMLKNAGIEVNSFLLPRFNPEEAERFPSASLNVLYPDPSYDELYKKYFGNLGLRVVTPVAPYGLENTRRWFVEVAGALGMDDRAQDAWKSQVARAPRLEMPGGLRLAFVADARVLRRLADPAGVSGVPIVAMLKEMGFGIDYLVYTEGKGPALKERTGRHGVKWFRTPEEMRRLLEEGSFGAVYSGYFFDRRLTRAGKAQFSVLDLEMGIEGAGRSLERLLNLCRFPFYRRYRKQTGETS